MYYRETAVASTLTRFVSDQSMTVYIGVSFKLFAFVLISAGQNYVVHDFSANNLSVVGLPTTPEYRTPVLQGHRGILVGRKKIYLDTPSLRRYPIHLLIWLIFPLSNPGNWRNKGRSTTFKYIGA